MEKEIMEKLKLKIAISEIKKEGEVAMNKKKSFITKKIGIAACACLVLTTGVVFAKDIENYFKNLFTNTNEAIEAAVENGYVQTEKMDYVYDNNVGIKVDSLVLDDLHLNISFAFEIDDENVKSIRFKDFIISSNIGRNIYESELKYRENLDEIYLANSVEWMQQAKRIDDKTLVDSILFGLRETDKEIKELGFDVTKLHVVYQDDTWEEIDGNWNFSITISDEMRKSSRIKYVLKEESELVESCTGLLSATGFKMTLKLKEPFDVSNYILNNLSKIDNVGAFYIKHNSELFAPKEIHYSFDNLEFTLPYESIGTYSGDFDKIEIYLEPWDTSIFLEKE